MGWRGIFFTGLLLWIATIVVTAVTRNLNILPTVILLGSFLVPATAVVWFIDHYQSPELTGALVVRAFIVGGVLGTLAASLLESWLLRPGWAIYFGVGLIEEGAKLLALIWVARGMTRRTVRDGIVLGASVGFGFAALESSGYALNALIVIQNGQPVGLSLSDLVITEILRGVLAPVGHGLWTGILGGVLFAATPRGGFHLTRGVVGTYLLISALHGLFDSSGGIASAIAPASDAASIAVSLVMLVVISVIALVVLIRVWRSETDPRVGIRLGSAESAPPEAA
ncbi:MAG: PrsW family intramembrane metalloprotease [Chloroflexi bacterium]|nr:PrsW family intramembrane metalloprotease [Chloroflexota bacterium]